MTQNHMNLARRCARAGQDSRGLNADENLAVGATDNGQQTASGCNQR